jgi:hypothetical protein
LIDCDVKAVLGDLPLCQPHIGFVWPPAWHDVLCINRLFVASQEWFVGEDEMLVAAPVAGSDA